jgi:hypothetical protein
MGVALFRLAAIYVAQGQNLDVALTLAVSAKQKLPDDPGVNDILGWIYARRGFPDRGIPLLEQAVLASPSNAIFDSMPADLHRRGPTAEGTD